MATEAGKLAPMSHVNAWIGIHEAIDAVTELARVHPADRLSMYQADDLVRAADMIRQRITEHNLSKATPPPAPEDRIFKMAGL